MTVHLSSDLESTFKNYKAILDALVSYFPTGFSFGPLHMIVREERKRRNVCAYNFQLWLSNKNFEVVVVVASKVKVKRFQCHTFT